MKLTPKEGLSDRVTLGKEYEVVGLDSYGDPIVLDDNGTPRDASVEADLWDVTDESTVYTQSQAKRMHELLGYIAESYRGTTAGEQANALLAELEKGE